MTPAGAMRTVVATALNSADADYDNGTGALHGTDE
jgi:hypothetical protein